MTAGVTTVRPATSREEDDMRWRRGILAMAATIVVACGGTADITVPGGGGGGTETEADANEATPTGDASTGGTSSGDTSTDDGDGEVAAAPDADTLTFLRDGLWNVPETETRCGWEGSFSKAPGTVLTRYQDPSDRGDFYVACRTDEGEPTWPLRLEIRDPSGTVVASASVAPSDVREDVSGFAVTVLVVESGGRARFGGLSQVIDGLHVTQVHWWLPHDRPTGTWTVRLGNAEATVAVTAPCGSDTGSSDPLDWPLDIDFARNGFGEGLDQHCLAWPDVVGRDDDEGVAAFQDVVERRGLDLDVLVETTCDDTQVDLVVVQSPSAGSFQSDEFEGAIPPLVLTVAEACADPTDPPSEPQTDTSTSFTEAVPTEDPTAAAPTETTPPEEDPS